MTGMIWGNPGLGNTHLSLDITNASGRSAQVGYEESLESIGQGGVFNAS